MNFVEPSILWATPVVGLVVGWFLWRAWRRRQALVRLFVSERLLPQLLEGVSPGRQKIKLGLLVGAVLCLMLAMARPQWGFTWEEANQRGRDILVAIDTSRSMLAEDMAPNRLARAKLAALDLLKLAKNDRLGLIAFAGGAFLQSPLTLDDEAFRQNVNALDTTIIPQGGTSLSEAIDTALSAFSEEEGDNHHVLVIFTDGEDQDTGALEAAQKAADKNLKIFTVGVGTPAGELLRVADESGKSAFIKDSEGNVVKSRLNEDLLRQIATKANGFYLGLREGNAMQTLYRQGLEPLPTSEISSKLVKHLREQFQWPLGIAIALLIAEVLLPSAPAKKRSASGGTSGAKKEKGAASAAVALFLLMFALPTVASPAKAYKNYQEGNFKDARNEYERLLEKKPDDPKLRYNAGAAAFKAGAYDAAVKDFSAAATAQDLKLQEMAYYNLGNSNFKLGEEEGDPQKKMALWQQAVQNFDSSLKLNSKDEDAKHNRDLVNKMLEELKKQQQEQKKDDKDKKDDKKEDNKDENKDQQKQDQKDQKDQQKQDNKDEQSKQDQQKKDQQKDNKDSKSEQEKKDQEKKDQEKKEQQKKDQAAKDKKDSQKEDGKEQGEEEKKDPKAEAEQEARAAALGQMTPKQAQQMLDAQKSDEKALIYRQLIEGKKGRDRLLKDW